MGDTLGSPTISTKPQETANSARVAKLCAKWSKTCLVTHRRKPVCSEEPDEVALHVRICGGSAGQPVLLPGHISVPRKPGQTFKSINL